MLQARIIPHAALFLAMLAWSSSFIALKIALSAYSPLTVMAGRMVVASLVCLPLYKHVRASFTQPATRKILLICVICEPCLYFLFETFSLRYTTSGQSAMVMALLPLVTAAGAWFLLKERLGARVWGGFFLAIAGVVWLTVESVASISAPNPLLGNILEALAVVCAAGYTICARRLSHAMNAVEITAAMSYAGLIFFMPLALLPFSIQPVPLEITVPGWLPVVSIIYLGTVVTFTGYGLYNYGICRLSAGKAAAYTNLIPVMTLIMGMVWLQESLVPMQYLASLMVVAGVALSQGGGNNAGKST